MMLKFNRLFSLILYVPGPKPSHTLPLPPTVTTLRWVVMSAESPSCGSITVAILVVLIFCWWCVGVSPFI